MTTDARVWESLWTALEAARRRVPLTPQGQPGDGTLALAEARGVGPLVARGLGLPSSNAPERSRAGRATMVWVHKLLQSGGVTHAFFKGAFADGVLWGGHGHRGYTDIDVLVAPADQAGAVDALTRAKFKPLPLPTLQASVAEAKARVFLPPNALFLTVDLHHRPLNDPPFPARSEDVFAAAQVYETRDGPMPGPCPEHMIVWSAGNLAGGRLQGIVAQAADAAAWVERAGFRWDLLVDTASRWRARACTYAFLRLLEVRLGAPVPCEVQRALSPHPVVAAMVERVFGVSGPPLEHTTGLKGLLEVEWPLTGRLSWPAQRLARLLRLRFANAVLARRG